MWAVAHFVNTVSPEIQQVDSAAQPLFKKGDLTLPSPKTVPILSAANKQERVAFAKKAFKREQVAWRRVVVTNSNCFQLYAKGRRGGRWCSQSTRGTVGSVSQPIAVHAYMELTYWGFTDLKFVTGTDKQVKKYLRATGGNHAGVAAEEYHEGLQQHFLPQVDSLFLQAGKWSGNWQLQQDNASCHKVKKNMKFIAKHVPGGHILPWPPCSPDLSPIETLWAWMDQQLHKMHKPKNVEELKQSLETVRQSNFSCYAGSVLTV